MKKLMILCMSNFTSAHLFTTGAKPQFLSHIAYRYVNLRHRLGIVKHIMAGSPYTILRCASDRTLTSHFDVRLINHTNLNF